MPSGEKSSSIEISPPWQIRLKTTSSGNCVLIFFIRQPTEKPHITIIFVAYKSNNTIIVNFFILKTSPAVIDSDFDIGHPDLAGKIEPLYDPYDSIPFSCPPFSDHGTMVASFVAGETAGNDDTSRGQLASVGFNTKMICYKAWNVHYLQRALHASTVMGAKILTSSSGGWSRCPDPTGIERLVVKEISDTGTTIIMPAGNGEFDTHNFCPTVDSVHCSFSMRRHCKRR